jgi:DNA repair protein RecO (recombination protein O)
MPPFRTPGIVLRARDLGERDRLVSLYTRDLGRIHAVARGARRLTSRFGGALELFTWGDAVGFEPAGRDLLRLDQFDIRRSFRRVREDLGRLGQGARIVEALVRLTPERDPQPDCFALLVRALGALETGPASRVTLAFVLRLLDLLGHRPALDRCVGCARLVVAEIAGFDPIGGGIVCRACVRPAVRTVAARTLGALRGLQRATWPTALRARIPAAVEREAGVLLDGYLAALSGAELRASRFVARIRVPADLG